MHVQITCGPENKPSVLIDGREFVGHIAEDGIAVDLCDPHQPTVTLTLLPDEVAIDADADLCALKTELLAAS